jgi:8-oxo-dGTP pyrophosphatase MutT (NUDIX family)
MDTEFKMLVEFLKLSSEDDGSGEFVYTEEREEITEEPLKFLGKLFKKRVTKQAPTVMRAPNLVGDPKSVAPQPAVKKSTPSYSQDPTKLKKNKPKEKWISAGCVVFDSIKDMSKVYVIKQKNWGTYAFPKGRVDDGESVKRAAVREVAEETGLKVSMLPSGYLGKGVGGFSITHFFAAVRTGGSPGQHDHEVEQVKLVSFTQAYKLFRRSGGAAGKRDLMILRKAWEYANKYRKGKVPEWPGK